MECNFERISKIIKTEDGLEIETYGIKAVSKNGNVLKSVDDITTDSQKLDKFISLCNQGNLALRHLNDVIEDFLP